MDKSQVPNPKSQTNPKFLKNTDYTDKGNSQINTDASIGEYETRTTSTMHESRETSTVFDLTWIDEFIRKIRPYIYVREDDNLLILIPNQAYKLNESGVTILSYLLKGNSINELLQSVGESDERQRDLHHFFCDLRAAVSGCLHENEKRAAVAYYEFNGAPNEYPVLSEIAVTYRCNLSCEFCYVGERNSAELNTNDTKKILFKIFHEAQIPSVSFTGGEPLLRHDICELVGYASKIGLWTNLITNGTLLNKDLVQDLKERGLASVQISLEGPNQAIHDRITGKVGSFAASIRGIKMIMDAGIPMHTNTTVSRSNLDYLKEILTLIKQLGLNRLSMNLLIPCGTAADRQDLWVSYSEIGKYVLGLKHYAEHLDLKLLWYSPVPICKFNSIAYGFGNKSCAAITGLLSVDPMGNIIPCSSWREPVGSLLKQNFKDIWQSPMLCYFKNAEYAPPECHRCVHFDLCKGGCPLYWQAFGFGEINGRRESISRI